MSLEINKPLYALTIGEFIQLNKEVLQQESQHLIELSNITSVQKEEDDIIFMKDVMQITGYKKATVYTKISRFEIPVLSRKKPVTFSKKEIIKWIKEGKPSTLDKDWNNFINRQK